MLNVFRRAQQSPNHKKGPDSNRGQTITVNLRIEGPDRTIFEGQIITAGHTVTTPTAGSHDAGRTKTKDRTWFPTPTGTLDDAARLHGFTYDGKYWAEYDDMFITQIADTAQDDHRFWGILLNYEYTKLGGCQQPIASDDHVLFAFDAFHKKKFLKIIGPTTTTVGVPITVTIINGATDSPISGATVGGQQTDEDGRATLVFRSPGVRVLKAERSEDSIRSNALTVNVLR